MKNQVRTGTPTSREFALCPSTVVGGDAVLIGKLPAVALSSYDANTGGAVFCFNGSFALSVTAKSSLSPSTGAAINPGDKIYADGGTLDAGTNVTTGFTLDANSSTGVLFGWLAPDAATISSSATNTSAEVQIGGSL